MEALYEEHLDEAKVEIEKLREQYRVQAELAENLKRSHIDQQSKIKEVSDRSDKLVQELNEKDDALSAVHRTNEELKCSLEQREGIIKNLTSAIDKLRADSNVKLSNWEEENKALALALDDANAKNIDQEQKICSLKEENERVKRLLAVSQKKCSESENKDSKELRGRDDAFLKLEDENRKLQDKLKWTIEQFGHLEEAHETLLNQFKIKEMERVNIDLGSDSDEIAKRIDQEQQICALKEEIEGLKRLLTISKKKHSETEKIARAAMGVREDVFSKLEEENRKFEDQLKWKKEQFDHLHGAHEKLRNEFKTSEKEWNKEKSSLLVGISSLQTKLESQIRNSKELQTRLELCNNALAHAESKRKLLEVELSECKVNFGSVCGEYDEAKSKFETINTQRDQEIANMRCSLATKDILYKEMEYQLRKMEQENQEMLFSMKQLQETRMQEAGVVSSSSKLQKKLKYLEQVHRGCLANLQSKESEWRSEMEKLTAELDFCKLESETKYVYLNELKAELESCDSLILNLEMLNQESSMLLLILKSEFSEAQHKLADGHAYVDFGNKEMEENISGLVEELETKKAAFNRVQKDLEEEREKVMVLTETVRNLKELQLALQKEVERLREMLEETKKSGLNSEAEVVHIKNDLKKVHEALGRANEELYMKFCEANEIEFELHIQKSVAEQLEVNLKQNNQLRREVEASLFSQMEVEMNLKQEKERLDHLVEEKENIIHNLQQQLVELNESIKMERENTLHAIEENSIEDQIENVEKGHEHLHQLVEEKDQSICDLQHLVANLEQEFESSTSSFSSRLMEMHEDRNLLREYLEKFKASEVCKEVEIQEKNVMIVDLENDLSNLLHRVEQQEKSLNSSEEKICEILSELERKQIQVHELESELVQNKQLINDMSLLSERIEQLSIEDEQQLMENLANIVKNVEIDGDDEYDPVKENMNSFFFSPLVKKAEAVQEERSPLKAINMIKQKF